MTAAELEGRVVALERAVAQLVARSARDRGEKDWRSTIGMFADDPVMREIQEEGRKIREAEREQALRDASDNGS
jgi:hypothetical protein